MHERKRQRGLSMIGFLFVATVVVVCVMIGFRVTPAYIEYYSVTKALDEALATAKDLNSAAEIRSAFQKRADAGYIDSVTGKDVDVVKDKNTVTASASWTRKLPLVGNASLLLDFEASATR
jgi:Tfp pilus assembly major pilin PilA